MLDASTATSSFLIGQVRVQPFLGSMADVRADVIVQPGSAVINPAEIHLVRWVWEADEASTIRTALARLSPFQLGDVIVAPAGSLQAKYLFNAVVLDRTKPDAPSGLIHEDVVGDTVRKCIAIAVALGLKSIAFTPWGTRATSGSPQWF